MARSLTVISPLLQSTTHCRYRVYTKFLLTYTAIYRGNRKVLGITALQPQSHFHLGTPYTSVACSPATVTYSHTLFESVNHTFHRMTLSKVLPSPWGLVSFTSCKARIAFGLFTNTQEICVFSETFGRDLGPNKPSTEFIPCALSPKKAVRPWR